MTSPGKKLLEEYLDKWPDKEAKLKVLRQLSTECYEQGVQLEADRAWQKLKERAVREDERKLVLKELKKEFDEEAKRAGTASRFGRRECCVSTLRGAAFKIQRLIDQLEQQAQQDPDDALMDRVVTVCDKCFTAACWQGKFLCQESQNAGTVDMPVSYLMRLDLEHPEHWCQNQEGEESG